jgi:hypothetical protein
MSGGVTWLWLWLQRDYDTARRPFGSGSVSAEIELGALSR